MQPGQRVVVSQFGETPLDAVERYAVNFGGGGNGEGTSAVATGSDDILRVVQTLMAAKVITGDGVGKPQPAAPPPSPRPRNQ